MRLISESTPIHLFAYTSRMALAQASGQMSSGELEFRQYCAPCHRLEGTGDGPVAPTLNKKPADLTSLAKNNGSVFPAKEVHDFIYGTRTVASHGTREMPIWGYAFMFRQGALGGPFVPERTPQEAEDKIARLVDYVKSNPAQVAFAVLSTMLVGELDSAA